MATFVHSMLQSFAFKAPLSLRISVPPTAFTTTSSCSTQQQQPQQQQQQQQRRPFYAHIIIPPDAIFNTDDLAALLSNNPTILIEVLRKLRTFRDQKDAEYFIGAGLLQRILGLVRHLDPHVCDGALWVLINLTSLPGDYGAQAILGLNGLPPLYAALLSPNLNIHKSALWCLCNMAGSSKHVAVAMIAGHYHLIAPAVLISPLTAPDSRHYCARLFSNFAKHLNREQALFALQTLASMPTSNLTDIETMIHVLWGLASIAKKFTTIGDFPIRVVVDHLREGCKDPALEIIVCLSSSEDTRLIRSMVDLGTIGLLHNMLRGTLVAQKNIAAFALSNIACDVPDEFLTSPGLLFEIIHSLENSECMWILCNLLSKLTSDGCTSALQKGALLRLAETLEKSEKDLTSKQVNVILEGIQHLFVKTPTIAMLHARLCNLGGVLYKFRERNPMAMTLLEDYETRTGAHIGVD
jgi:hypothetical protein